MRLAFIFAKNLMMAERKSSANYWVRFLLWTAYLVILIIVYPQLLWTAFPGIFTNFVLAMDLM